jgi:hypothetical protein
MFGRVRVIALLCALLASTANAQVIPSGPWGSINYWGVGGLSQVLNPGLAGQCLTTQGVGSAPVWVNCQVSSMSLLPSINTNQFYGNVSGQFAPPVGVDVNTILNTVGYDIARPPAVESILYKSNVGPTFNWQTLPPGPSGNVLTSGGPSNPPFWATPTQASLVSICSTVGAILYFDTPSLLWKCLAPGTAGQVLQTGGASGNPSWLTLSATAPITYAGGVIGIAGSPLTANNDTNVTLTLGGSPSTALLQSSSLTLGWAGTLSLARGGTGAGTQSAAASNIFPTPTRAGDLAYWNGSAWVTLAGNNSGTNCLSENSSGVPSFASCGSATAPQGRLTLTSGTPITASDVTGATTLYYSPIGHYLPLPTGGGAFAMVQFSEVSQATTDTTKSPAAVTTNACYDIFGWSDAGTFRATRGPAWSTCDGSSATRGTGAGTSEIDFTTLFPTNKNAITNGPAAGMGVLLGTVRSNGLSQLTDSVAFRYVSNAYNSVLRPMRAFEATATWNYSTAQFRQANGSSANQLAFVQSLTGQALAARIGVTYSNTSTTQFGVVCVQIDSVNISTCSNNTTVAPTVGVAGQLTSVSAFYSGAPGIGGHTAIWAEYSSAATGTFYGTGGGTVIQGGIQGEISN